MKKFWLLCVLGILSLYIGAVHAQRPDAPQYAQRGQYAVGTREITIQDENRPLNVTLWYPAEAAPGEEPEHQYLIALAFTVLGHAYPEAPIAEANTPFPLIIFSHGSGGSRLLSLFYTEHLASYGFIVMAADHPGNSVLNTFASRMNLAGGQDFATNYAQRPKDILRQIALAEELNNTGDFAGKIDMEQIGVTGHSFGGFTALSVGGARLNFDGLRDWCSENQASAIDNVCFLLNMENDIAISRGYDVVPEGSWDATTDSRIKAIVALAPWNAPILDIHGITVPTMIMVGTADDVTFPERDAYVIYETLTSAKTLVTFANAGHYIFIDECPPLLVNFGAFNSCSDLVWDMQRVHDLTNHFVTAFFLAHLGADTTAGETLITTNEVSFVGVEYTLQEQ